MRRLFPSLACPTVAVRFPPVFMPFGQDRARPVRVHILALLLLGACGSEPAERAGGNEVVELPQPSGPPLVQQVDGSDRAPAVASVPGWESVAGPEGMRLRLTQPDGALVLSLACVRSPARLVAAAPAFSPIGSEDRFSLGLGEEPVTLVADPTRQAEPGVTAEGPVPENLLNLLEGAAELSAVYGAQRAGPFPAPPAELKEAFGKSCRGLE